MSIEERIQNNPKPYFTVVLAILLMGIAVIIIPYMINFANQGISKNSEDWASFATYFGSLLAPIIGFFTLAITTLIAINIHKLEDSRSRDLLRTQLERSEKLFHKQITPKLDWNIKYDRTTFLVGKTKQIQLIGMKLVLQNHGLGPAKISKLWIEDSYGVPIDRNIVFKPINEVLGRECLNFMRFTDHAMISVGGELTYFSFRIDNRPFGEELPKEITPERLVEVHVAIERLLEKLTTCRIRIEYSDVFDSENMIDVQQLLIEEVYDPILPLRRYVKEINEDIRWDEGNV